MLVKRPRGRPVNLIKKIVMMDKQMELVQKRQKRDENKEQYSYLQKVYLEGLTNVEKQAIHCTSYQAGFKPVTHGMAQYIVRSEISAPSNITNYRIRNEPVPLKDGQK